VVVEGQHAAGAQDRDRDVAERAL
jgi:phosphate transport system protein